MLRQASSRNQRSKGFKLKHALQIGLLVAVCIWLLYQVKHSHEKKRAFEERNSKLLNKAAAENQADFFNFGRKEFPHTKERVSVNETLKEDENEGTQEEGKQEMEGEEGRDDEIDEQDQEKGDDESTEEEDKDSQDNEGDLFDNQDNEGVTQDAREENYRRDDASSAVVHDEEKVGDKVDYDSDSKGENDTSVDGSKSEVVRSENVTNGTDDGSTGDNVSISNTTIVDFSNSTAVEDNSLMEQQTNFTAAAESNGQIESQTNSTTDVYDNKTAIQNISANNALESWGTMDISSNNTTTVGDDSPKLQNVVDISDISDDSSSHSVISEEERDAGTDLSVLPDIQNGVSTTDDEAAE